MFSFEAFLKSSSRFSYIDSFELVIFHSSSSPNLEDSCFVLRSLIKKTITPKEITEKIDRITTTESIDEYFRTY